MENFVTEYGNALVALVSGAILIVWGWQRYTAHTQWLKESKRTDAKVVGIEEVTLETESSVEKYDRPTFQYHTTGEILIAKARQYFPKGTLKVGDPHRVLYNHRTPGRIHSEMVGDFSHMGTFLFFLTGGALVIISMVLFMG